MATLKKVAFLIWRCKENPVTSPYKEFEMFEK